MDSNQRPWGYEPHALTSAPRRMGEAEGVEPSPRRPQRRMQPITPHLRGGLGPCPQRSLERVLHLQQVPQPPTIKIHRAGPPWSPTKYSALESHSVKAPIHPPLTLNQDPPVSRATRDWLPKEIPTGIPWKHLAVTYTWGSTKSPPPPNAPPTFPPTYLAETHLGTLRSLGLPTRQEVVKGVRGCQVGAWEGGATASTGQGGSHAFECRAVEEGSVNTGIRDDPQNGLHGKRP